MGVNISVCMYVCTVCAQILYTHAAYVLVYYVFIYVQESRCIKQPSLHWTYSDIFHHIPTSFILELFISQNFRNTYVGHTTAVEFPLQAKALPCHYSTQTLGAGTHWAHLKTWYFTRTISYTFSWQPYMKSCEFLNASCAISLCWFRRRCPFYGILWIMIAKLSHIRVMGLVGILRQSNMPSWEWAEPPAILSGQRLCKLCWLLHYRPAYIQSLR